MMFGFIRKSILESALVRESALRDRVTDLELALADQTSRNEQQAYELAALKREGVALRSSIAEQNRKNTDIGNSILTVIKAGRVKRRILSNNKQLQQDLESQRLALDEIQQIIARS